MRKLCANVLLRSFFSSLQLPFKSCINSLKVDTREGSSFGDLTIHFCKKKKNLYLREPKIWSLVSTEGVHGIRPSVTLDVMSNSFVSQQIQSQGNLEGESSSLFNVTRGFFTCTPSTEGTSPFK